MAKISGVLLSNSNAIEFNRFLAKRGYHFTRVHCTLTYKDIQISIIGNACLYSDIFNTGYYQVQTVYNNPLQLWRYLISYDCFRTLKQENDIKFNIVPEWKLSVI